MMKNKKTSNDDNSNSQVNYISAKKKLKVSTIVLIIFVIINGIIILK